MSELALRGSGPDSWPVVVSIPVAWGEMDALGHINNVHYYRYLETARVEFIRRVDAALGAPPRFASGVAQAPATARSLGFILQAAEARFRRPVYFPDTLRVTAGLERLDADRFSLLHVVYSTEQDFACALGRSVIVRFDYDANAKVSLSPEMAARMREFPAP